MIILYELIDFIEMIRIKMFALYAEVPFDKFCKELCFAFVLETFSSWNSVG